MGSKGVKGNQGYQENVYKSNLILNKFSKFGKSIFMLILLLLYNKSLSKLYWLITSFLLTNNFKNY